MCLKWLMSQVGNVSGSYGSLIWISCVVDLGYVFEVIDGSSG